jgi:NADPH-dependent 2,4-dienoyl-CoA reductase/sulfur reductase-like enzyme
LAAVPTDPAFVLNEIPVTPATDWLSGSGLGVDDGVLCDARGAAEGGTDVVAAGGVARWWHPLYERHLRTEHWDHAGHQGAAAARTLLAGRDRAEDYDEVPYFWSDQYDVKGQMLGVPTDYDALEIIEGDPDAWEFVAVYGRGGCTIAVLRTISNRVYAYQSTVSLHLGRVRTAGLVQSERRGFNVYHRPRRDALTALCTVLNPNFRA